MNLYIRNSIAVRHFGPTASRAASAADVLRQMGVASGRAPRAGHPPTDVQGISVRVVPLYPPLPGTAPVGRHGIGHRVLATCPRCGLEMSVGRLEQHALAHIRRDVRYGRA